MAGILILLVAFSFFASMLVTLLMQRASPRVGLVAHPGERKVHKAPTPSGGGVAIFLAVWLPVGLAVAACTFFEGMTPARWPVSAVADHVAHILSLAPKLRVVFLGALIIWGLGLADDRWGLPAWFRLLAEGGVALMLIMKGMSVSVFLDSALLGGLITACWIVGLINAFNMLDNMDGLSGGVGLIIAAIFGVVAFQTGQIFMAALLCCLAGALGGFLVYNFPPATIFMGDSGSTLLGYLLAVMSIEFTFFQPERPYFPVVVPLLVFGLPLFDMITVVWIRVRSGRSPFKGDTNHFSHRLVALGMTPRQAVLTIYLVTATVALGATVLYYATAPAILVIFAQTVAVFAIIGILERARPKKA